MFPRTILDRDKASHEIFEIYTNQKMNILNITIYIKLGPISQNTIKLGRYSRFVWDELVMTNIYYILHFCA